MHLNTVHIRDISTDLIHWDYTGAEKPLFIAYNLAMHLRTVQRHEYMVVKLRTELKCGRTPWWLVRRPKGMETRRFESKKRLLERHEKALKTTFRSYLLQNM